MQDQRRQGITIFGAIGDWSKSGNLYSENQIRSVILELGIDIVGETDSVFTCLCPFHKNTDTPSFAVNKENGTYICFSPSCDRSGSLLSLVMRQGDLDVFPAKRLIARFNAGHKEIESIVEEIFNKRDELPSFPVDTINRMADNFWGSPAHEYMQNRGFTDKTLAYFGIGYSKNKGLVAIPVHDWEGTPVGVIGRTIKGKRFENSEKLPTRKTIFNIHRARKHGERVIVVESAMDVMRLHQAGFPCAVATCGGFFTDAHEQLLNRYFNEIIIMTDNDDPEAHRDLKCKKCPDTCVGHNPGRALGMKIQNKLKSKRIRWAAYDYGVIYPHDAKDVGDMTEEEIKQCIDNAIGTAELYMWFKTFPELAII
jgi:hypothetical protein